jgi:predicted phosphodiesterase
MSSKKQFSIVIIPDTQIVTKSHPSMLKQMTQWIADHSEALNIKAVLHLGDVVNDGALQEIQYQNAKESLDLILKKNLPLLIAIGNHDYDNQLASDRKSDMFNKYFGMECYRNTSYFGGVYEKGKTENMFTKLEIEGKKFVFLSLEFGPRDSILTWADEVLSSYRDHEAIIITHSYMFLHGERTKLGDAHNPKIYTGATGANDGEDMWQKLVKHHSNITAVFSGHHVWDHISYRTDQGDHDNVVFQSFQNWQTAENGGEGRLRILQYDLSENSINLKVLNPQTDLYEENPGYRVSFPGTFEKSGADHPKFLKDWKTVKYPVNSNGGRLHE